MGKGEGGTQVVCSCCTEGERLNQYTITAVIWLTKAPLDCAALIEAPNTKLVVAVNSDMQIVFDVYTHNTNTTTYTPLCIVNNCELL